MKHGKGQKRGEREGGERWGEEDEGEREREGLWSQRCKGFLEGTAPAPSVGDGITVLRKS